MITVQDLQEAIAECNGQRNPSANTAVKLAAYYIILDHLQDGERTGYSFASGPESSYESGTEFGKLIHGKNAEKVYPVIDELMDAVSIIHPRLYQVTLEKLRSV